METTENYRTHARWAGVLFIIATAFLFVGESFYKPALTAPDVLTAASAASNDIALGVLIEFACVLAIPLITMMRLSGNLPDSSSTLESTCGEAAGGSARFSPRPVAS